MDQHPIRPEAARRVPPRRRPAAALGLFLLAPLVGEFLLGNLPITWLWALVTLAPLYGGGALLIRETTRRLQWGWPSIIMLSLAYAIVEEAFVTQSLFNPDYVGLRLLDYGYISSLGIGAWWTVFVLAIHTLWSVSVPIALMESLTPTARRTPWLGRLGLTATAIVFLAACVLLYLVQQQPPFMASQTQWLVSAAAVLLLVLAASITGQRTSVPAWVAPPPAGETPPDSRLVGGVAFCLGSAFMSLAILSNLIPAVLNVAGMLTVLITGSLLLRSFSRRPGWSQVHQVAVAGGLLLTYAWYGFIQVPSVGDTDPAVDAAGNVLFSAGAVLLLAWAIRRAQSFPPNAASLMSERHAATLPRQDKWRSTR